MKHLLSGAIGAIIGAILFWMLWPGAECSDERATITALSQRNDAAQWEAKLVQHRLAKTQRELGEQLAQKVGTIDDVYSIPQPRVVISGGLSSGCELEQTWTPGGNTSLCAEVASITALAKSLVPMEAAVKQQAKDNHEFIPAAFRSYWGKVLAQGLTRGK